MLKAEGENEHNIHSNDRLWGPLKTIIIADFVMSVDNVLVIAGFAQGGSQEHQLQLVIFGLLMSIIIVWGS